MFFQGLALLGIIFFACSAPFNCSNLTGFATIKLISELTAFYVTLLTSSVYMKITGFCIIDLFLLPMTDDYRMSYVCWKLSIIFEISLTMARPFIICMFESVIIRSSVLIAQFVYRKLQMKSIQSQLLWKHLISPLKPIISSCSRNELKLTKASSTHRIVLFCVQVSVSRYVSFSWISITLSQPYGAINFISAYIIAGSLTKPSRYGCRLRSSSVLNTCTY